MRVKSAFYERKKYKNFFRIYEHQFHRNTLLNFHYFQQETFEQKEE